MLSQENYTKRISERIKISELNPVTTSIVREENDHNEAISPKIRYRWAVGT